MIIAADSNIPHVVDACASLGDVRIFDSADRASLTAALHGADALLCRSTIRVNENLLRDTKIRFVATATSGVEHVDTGFLDRHGIAFASAAGSNALSVAEYVYAALLRLACRDGWKMVDSSIGIIGVGHVGSWVELMAHRMGQRTVLCDPPLRERTGSAKYASLEEALACDIVTLHVPLTSDGPCPTSRMIDAESIRSLRPGAVLVNAARGGVMDMEAVRSARRKGALSALVLDVYPGEPAVSLDDIAAADIATPHIAGHSYDGKLLGTQMVYEALCAHIGVEAVWNYRDALPAAGSLNCVSPCSKGDMAEVEMLVRQAYDVMEDDRFMRSLAALDTAARAQTFARYRNTYRVRREFAAYHVDRLPCTECSERIVRALGFQC
jgi:erythronate-4-phosphate dehydrogenase